MHEIVDADDVLVGQIEAAPGLALHVAQHRAVVNDELGQKFERDIAFQLVVACQPDNAHPAATESLDQSVAVEDFLPVGKVSHGRIQSVAGGFTTHTRRLAKQKNRIKHKIKSLLHAVL